MVKILQFLTKGITSNTDERLRRVLDLFGIELDFLLLSGEEGFEKPSKEIFTRLVNSVGKDPSEVLHVGDDLEKDFLGAKTFGIHSVLISRTGSKSLGEREISTLAQLEPFLDL